MPKVQQNWNWNMGLTSELVFLRTNICIMFYSQPRTVPKPSLKRYTLQEPTKIGNHRVQSLFSTPATLQCGWHVGGVCSRIISMEKTSCS